MNLAKDFEVEHIVKLVREREVRVLQLQFPEGLKRYGPQIAKRIADETKASVLLSGNPCYGACDLDRDTTANLLVHFGHAEIPELANPSVCFIEVRSDIDVIPIVDDARELLSGRRVGVVTNVHHVHTLNAVRHHLESAGLECFIGVGDKRIKYEGQVLGCNFSAARAIDVDEYIYIGSGTFHALGVALATGKKVIAADPFLRKTSVADVGVILKQRYGLIAKAMEASTFCMLIGTKVGQQRLSLANELTKEATGRGYNAFKVTINEITPWTPYNFPADAYVNTACPRVAIDDASLFKAPLLNPNEFEMVLGKRELSPYVLDEFLCSSAGVSR
ncbi:MAG TPA: diphthamide biosynthesis enzyme Dph2 [Candidatus Acidoferrales bacterium]|nr:diphthamide biosynthesis enzyme Dph2 [Candidatus Acidoferrales bacterium]